MANQKLSAQDTQNLHAVFEEIVNSLINAASQHFEEKAGGKVNVSDKLKLSLAKKVFDMSKKFNSEAKIMKLIEVSNKVTPLVVQYVDEDQILTHVPAHLRDEKTVVLLDKAGAKEISALFKKLLPPPPAAVAAIPVAAAAAAATSVVPSSPDPEPVMEAPTPPVSDPASAVVPEVTRHSPLDTAGTGRIASTLSTQRVQSTVSNRVPSTVVSVPKGRNP